MKLSDISTLEGILFLSDLKNIDVVERSGMGSLSYQITLTCNDEIILSEKYIRKDLNSDIVLDLREVFLPYLRPSEPSVGIIMHDSYGKQCCITSQAIGISGVSAVNYPFTLYGFDRQVAETLSAIDLLRVPSDYIIPITSTRNVRTQSWAISDNRKRLIGGTFPATEYPCTQFAHLPYSSHVLRASVVDADGNVIFGPILQPSSGDFEQYMFANEYGGFDNIPMDGHLEFIPDYNFKTGKSSELLHMTSSTRTDKWKQNSGYQTSATIKALSKLVCARYIWHLKDGEWKRIIITSCDLSLKSPDNLHSISFEYKYQSETV